MGHNETNSSSSRDRSPSQQRHRHRRKDRDFDRELSSEKREQRSGRDVIERRSPRPRHDYSYSTSDHRRFSANFNFHKEKQNEVFDSTDSENQKDRDVSMYRKKADEKELKAKEEQMTMLEMSGDLTAESKQLTEGRKEETNISQEYSSDMKKARLHSTLVALLNDILLADIPK